MPKHDKAALFDSLGIRLSGFIILKKRVVKCISLLFLIACLRLRYIRGAAYACIYRTLLSKGEAETSFPIFLPWFSSSAYFSNVLCPLNAAFCLCLHKKKISGLFSALQRLKRESEQKWEREREEEVKEPFLSCLSIKNSTLSNTYHGFTFSFTEEAVGCMVKCPFNILLMPQTKCVECMQFGRTAYINPAIRIRARAYNITANTS